ncbi:MAG: TrkA family potassium uptake protein [Acinetobacter sp.]|nr:TrkA family potassium uptake protein [Acinetobacter sp.]
MAQFAVIGLGSFGGTVARQLVHLGHDVLGIDHIKKHVEDFSEILTCAVIADASDESVLSELQLQNYEAVVVAIGEDIEASILCVLHLKNMGVKKIWGAAKTQAHHMILSHLSVDKIIHPEQDMGVRIANALNYPIVRRYMALGDDHFIVKIKVPPPLTGLNLRELIRQETAVNLILFKRGKDVYKTIADDLILQEDDILVIEGFIHDLKKLYHKYL